MKRKRILSALVAAVAAVCFAGSLGGIGTVPGLAVRSFADGTVNGLSSSRNRVVCGETFTVSINVPPSNTLADTLGLKISYDPDVFEAITWNPQIPNTSLLSNRNNTKGFVATASANSSAVIDLSNGLTLNAVFRVKNYALPGDYNISLSDYELVNSDSEHNYQWTPTTRNVSIKIVNKLVKVSGNLSVKRSDENPVTATVKLKDSKGGVLSVNCQLSYNPATGLHEGTYMFDEAEGEQTYTLEASIPNCRTRTETLNIGTESITANSKLNISGDVNGDGMVRASDATQILKYLVGVESCISPGGVTDEYLLSVAHITSGTRLNVEDATQILRYVAGYSSILSV